jgi:hypothetical protein
VPFSVQALERVWIAHVEHGDVCEHILDQLVLLLSPVPPPGGTHTNARLVAERLAASVLSSGLLAHVVTSLVADSKKESENAVQALRELTGLLSCDEVRRHQQAIRCRVQ